MSTQTAIDRLIGWFSPAAALRRRSARAAMAYYDAAEPSRLRRFYRERGSQNELVQRGAPAIRAQARHLCRNHDIARGALAVLVNNIVGPKGIGIEPQPRRADGSIHAEYSAALLEAWRDWCRHPDVTGRYPWSRLQRSMVRAWLRDGEVFGQMITGHRPGLDHGTRVPFSIEAFEADLVPFELNDPARKIVQGFERSEWGKPLAIHVLKSTAAHAGFTTRADTKRIPWERALHLATLDHIGQIRGISQFASVITRLEDIKDYEESERVAAKIAAMLTAYVKRGTPDMIPEGATGQPRQIEFRPGMVIDDLGLGEDIGLIDTKRPNPNVAIFRAGQLRAVAAGLNASFSSISRDYNGTYSAQRQELVEQWIHYACLTDDFVGEIAQPVWEAFVEACHLSRVVPRPADVVPGTHDDCAYIAQSMPWINPMHEAQAWALLIENNLASESEAIRRRGGNPMDVIDQRKEFLDRAGAAGLTGAGTAEAGANADDDSDTDRNEPDAEMQAHAQRVRQLQEETAQRIAAAQQAEAEARKRTAEAAAQQAELEAARIAAETEAIAAAQARAATAAKLQQEAEETERALKLAALAASRDLDAARQEAADAQAERERLDARAAALRVEREQIELQAAVEGLEELRRPEP